MRYTDALELVLDQVLARFEPLSTDEEARIWTAVALGQATEFDRERLFRFFAPVAVQLAIQGFGRRLGGYEAAIEGLVGLLECIALYNPKKSGKVRFSLFLEAKLPQILYAVVNGIQTDGLSLDAETEAGTRYADLLAAPEAEDDFVERAERALQGFEGTTRRLLEGFAERKPLEVLATEVGMPIEAARTTLGTALQAWRRVAQN